MNLQHRTLHALNMLAAGMCLLAVLVYAWPLGSPEPDSTQANLKLSTSAPEIRADTADARDVVNANILSASRRAPSRRYVSPDVAEQAAFVMPEAFAPTVSNAPTDSMSSTINSRDDDEVPALYGIVSMNGTMRALLRLSHADASPALFGEGEKRGNYRVTSIRSNIVVLATPSGTRTLRLARPARGDSSGIKP